MQKNGNYLLTLQQQKSYQEQGFLILENFFSVDSAELLIKRAHALISEFDVQGIQTIFSTTAPHHERDQYFLESGDCIRFFFEQDAFDEEGKLKKDKHLSINKMGHALHELDPSFSQFSRSDKLKRLAADLGLIDPLLVQSMFICKQAHIGGEVTCHQDSTYLFVEPHPITGFWFALADSTLENGCLWALPGGHHSKLKSRLLRNSSFSTTHVTYDGSPWPLQKMQPLEVARGSLIVLHGLLPHMSKENKSVHSRPAYTLHLMSGKDQYAEDNWLQLKDGRAFQAM